jgi:nucleoside-diphosphate-sugar epimerase
MSFKVKKIGITGSSGFVGTKLLQVIDSECVAFAGDILDVDAVDTFVSKCSQVVHLAGILAGSFEDLMQVNLIGTKNIVDSCKKHEVDRLIFSSTGAVYGDPLDGKPCKEDDALKPNTLYGLSKFYAEEYIRYTGIPSLILRLPNVYGPGSKRGVIYNFIKNIANNNQIHILGTGEQRRDFLYIEDAIQAFVLATRYNGNESVFNISARRSHSLNDVVKILQGICPIFDVEYGDPDDNNPLKSLSEDILKAEKTLNWHPEVELQDGIERLVNDMKTTLEAV